MTEKKPPETTTAEKPAKPPMSKTATDQNKTSAEPKPKPVSQPKAKPKAETKSRAKSNGRANESNPAQAESPEEARSLDREALLEVDSYDGAEALLSQQPDLIEPARIVFGSVVPTSGQNAFVELAIRAAADDEALTLAEALKEKRQQHLNLTGPEAGQLLEFAAENVGKSPQLALTIAMLLTDDLTHLEDAVLWGQQKELVLVVEKALGIDATTLWEEISGPKPKPQPVAETPQPEPVKVEAVAEPEKVAPVLPPPVRVKKTRHPKKRHGVLDSPARWTVATGFVLLLTLMSCGVCALTWF